MTLKLQKPSGKAALLLLVAFLATWIFVGCSTLDRDYNATYDLTTGRTTAGIRITPGTGRRSVSANITGEMNLNYNNDLPKFYPEK